MMPSLGPFSAIEFDRTGGKKCPPCVRTSVGRLKNDFEEGWSMEEGRGKQQDEVEQPAYVCAYGAIHT